MQTRHHHTANVISVSAPASDAHFQTVALTQDDTDYARAKAMHDQTLPYVWALMLVALYFVPTIIAFRRRHHNRAAITGLNVVLGWTFLGWIAAFIRSLTYVRTGDRS